MIRVEGLAYSPGPGFALELPALAIARGSRTAIVGPSGTGKTTFLELLSGIRVPDRGRVEVEGTVVSALPERARRAFRARRIGFVFQTLALVDHLSALENILYPARIGAGVTPDAALRARARALAERVGLGARLAAKPARLSQGERQRVAICRALAMGPAVVLADEATGNLDPENKARILDLLFEEAGREGATVIAVTHDHALLDRFDRVIDFARAGEAA